MTTADKLPALAPQSYGIAGAQTTYGGPRGVWLECRSCDRSDRIVGADTDMPMAEAARIFRAHGWTGEGENMTSAACPGCIPAGPPPVQAIALKDAREGDVAFWKYDQFPHLLGGVIGQLPSHYAPRPFVNVERGTVFIGSYGGYFTPGFILNADDGAKLKAAIDHLCGTAGRVNTEARRMLDELKAATFAPLTPKGTPDA
jgi:hypothetical protein